MNAYRVVLILCRALAIALWWSAGISLIEGVTYIAGYLVQSPNAFQPLSTFVLLALAAVFWTLFGPALSASLVGSSALAVETMASSRAFNKEERALARAGAGLVVVVMGIPKAGPVLWGVGFGIWSRMPITDAGYFGSAYLTASFFLPAILHGIVGFLLAFRLGLQRLVNAENKEKSA